MTMCRTSNWTLLVFCAALSVVAAGDQVEVVLMRWTSESPDTLEMCANETLGDEIKLLVYTEESEQTDYIGMKGNETCASFNLSAPLAGQMTVYELLVVNDTGTPLQQGLVVFTLEGEIITCETLQYARITSGLVESSSAASACLPSGHACFAESPGVVCIEGLDSNNPELLVCTPVAVFQNASHDEADSFVADTLMYSEASFYISHSLEAPIQLQELLSFTEEEDSLLASDCSNDICTLDPFSPSSSLYKLCGVFLNDTGPVTNVGVTTFQDFLLTVDTATVPVNFHFVRPDGHGMFEVYHGDEPSSVFDNGPSKLDCSRVPANSFCYGAVIEETGYVAVSYVSKNNSVVAPASAQSFISDAEADHRDKSATDTQMTRSVNRQPDVADANSLINDDIQKSSSFKAEITSRDLKKKLIVLDIQKPRIEEVLGEY